MLCTVGLPTHVYSRLTQWFSRATDEGILEELAVVPPDVLAADPGAQRAWCWLLKLMREQVLGSVLQAEREKVESSVLELRAYHAPRRSTRMLVSAAERRRASMRGSVGSLGSSVGSLGSAGSWGSSAEGGGAQASGRCARSSSASASGAVTLTLTLTLTLGAQPERAARIPLHGRVPGGHRRRRAERR